MIFVPRPAFDVLPLPPKNMLIICPQSKCSALDPHSSLEIIWIPNIIRQMKHILYWSIPYPDSSFGFAIYRVNLHIFAWIGSGFKLKSYHLIPGSLDWSTFPKPSLSLIIYGFDNGYTSSTSWATTTASTEDTDCDWGEFDIRFYI